MSLILIVLGYLIVGLYEATEIINKREFNKLKCYLGMMAVNLGLSIIVLYTKETKNIAQVIEKIMQPIIK